MKVLTYLIILILVTIPVVAFGYTQDVDKIDHIFAAPGGSFAFSMGSGHSNADATYSRVLPEFDTGGIADRIFQSTVLSAKRSGQDIPITIDGCSGDWYNVLDIYIE